MSKPTQKQFKELLKEYNMEQLEFAYYVTWKEYRLLVLNELASRRVSYYLNVARFAL